MLELPQASGRQVSWSKLVSSAALNGEMKVNGPPLYR
jgi:hypothetical protein